MPSVSAIALSGIAAAQSRLDSAAHNIANAATPGFRRQQTAQSSVAGAAGVSHTVSQVDTVGRRLEADLVDQLQARNAWLANLSVFRAADRNAGALLDAVG
jgi:flagellar hook-associated protein FlgK